MEDIIARQNASAKPATGKTFLLGIARIILELAIAQLVVNFLITATGIGLLNLLFYAFAIVLLVRFMTRTVAGCIYTLKAETLVLQRMLGDSTVLGVEIPLARIVSIRPYAFGERLSLDYRQVTYVDMACAPGLRLGVAFWVSLASAWLARAIAGRKAHRPAGYVIVYEEEGKRRACAFRPDVAFAAALESACPLAFGADERLDGEPLQTYFARSLRAALGELYPHVPDAVTQEELDFEREEFARRRAQKIEKDAKKRKMSVEAYQAERTKKARKKASARAKRKKALERAAGAMAFLRPVRELILDIWAKLLQDEPEDDEAPKTDGETPRRRRGRQE